MAGYIERKRVVRSKNNFAAHEHPSRNLAKFPEEILLSICRAIHDTPIPEFRSDHKYQDLALFDEGTRDIQNVRLTCRVFNRIGSECLIRFVVLDLSSESLARFKAIMGHPTLSKAVHVVRIRLPVYCSTLYNHPYRFACEIGYRLGNFWRHFGLQSAFKSLVERYATSTNPEQTPPGPELCAAVIPAYREFRRRYQAQRRLLEGPFVKDVTNALLMRNTGTPLRLEITDQNDLSEEHQLPVFSFTKENRPEVLSSPPPSSWKEVNNRATVPHGLAWLVPQILAAFADDRIHIDDLHLDISCTKIPDQTAFTQVDKTAIKAAMRNLRSYTYIGEFESRFGAQTPTLSSALYECLPPASLQHLELQEVVLRPHQLPNLSRIHLTLIDVDAEMLTPLLQPLMPHGVVIILDSCNVDQGSWADVLDLLRSKQPLWCCLEEPMGWEFSDWYIENHFPDVDFDEHYESSIRRAKQYIEESSDTNPFREDDE